MKARCCLDKISQTTSCLRDKFAAAVEECRNPPTKIRMRESGGSPGGNHCGQWLQPSIRMSDLMPTTCGCKFIRIEFRPNMVPLDNTTQPAVTMAAQVTCFQQHLQHILTISAGIKMLGHCHLVLCLSYSPNIQARHPPFYRNSEREREKGSEQHRTGRLEPQKDHSWAQARRVSPCNHPAHTSAQLKKLCCCP